MFSGKAQSKKHGGEMIPLVNQYSYLDLALLHSISDRLQGAKFKIFELW